MKYFIVMAKGAPAYLSCIRKSVDRFVGTDHLVAEYRLSKGGLIAAGPASHFYETHEDAVERAKLFCRSRVRCLTLCGYEPHVKEFG